MFAFEVLIRLRRPIVGLKGPFFGLKGPFLPKITYIGLIVPSVAPRGPSFGLTGLLSAQDGVLSARESTVLLLGAHCWAELPEIP